MWLTGQLLDLDPPLEVTERGSKGLTKQRDHLQDAKHSNQTEEDVPKEGSHKGLP